MMIKEFAYDLNLNEEIENVELISSVFTNEYLECEIKCKGKEKEKIEKCKIPLKEKIQISNLDEYSIDLLDIDCYLENSQILLKGKIDYRKKEKEEDSFSLDPFKQSLLKSFISFKRNKEEVDIISTLDTKEIIPYQDLKLEEENNIELINDQSTEEFIDEISLTKEKEDVKQNENLIKDNYVSSFFYYRLTNNENINDIIKKFNLTLDDFYKYNKKSEYKENCLIRIKKHEK